MGYSPQAPRRVVVEVWNAITHGLAAVLSLIGLAVLLFGARSVTQVVAYSIYGISLFLLFFCSTMYHSLSFTRAREIFQKLDHSAIYLLIAGTYTPYLLLAIADIRAYVLLGLVWLLAVAGIVFEIIAIGKFPKLSTYLYLGLGWLSLLIILPLIQLAGWPVFWLLLAGGITYSLGTIFYKQKHIDWMHIIWHLFVMGGAGFMFASIMIL
ncbi:PAQR family membrane homeostasis protein TrhA [Streptococcus ovuberis]|uniref:Hemolysin III family protein n=1 Tax=Streptococcus ovuberis TaxID=1936207 RepID=A0A7X6N1G3_9STRE|nr:hemolysin III family protein [Streptococcus ovuberis]NKZ20319.1 hemolysin III family protein [Streptococcus ovuberis]